MNNTTSQDIFRFACLNAHGLAGKASVFENLLNSFDIDFVFVSETWCNIGSTSNLSPNIIFPIEFEKASAFGHNPYGSCLMINPRKCHPTDFTLLFTHPSRHAIAFHYRGIRFICCYLCPVRGDDFLNDFFESIDFWAASEEPVVLMGDFNSRHTDFQDVTCNDYGKWLKEWICLKGLQRLDSYSGRWTFLKEGYKSVPDHHFANEWASSLWCRTMTLENSYTAGSDHRMLVSEIVAFTENGSAPAMPLSWNRWNLKKAECIEELRAYLWQHAAARTAYYATIIDNEDLPAQERLDTIYNDFTEFINEALEKVIGKVCRKQRWAECFFSKEIKRELDIAGDLYSLWYANRFTVGSIDRWITYDRQQGKVNKLIKEKRQKCFTDFTERVEKMNGSEQLRVMSQLRKKKSGASSNIKTDPESMEAHKIHFENQFDNSLPEVLLCERPYPPDDESIVDLVSQDNCWDALLDTPSGKAAGESGLVAEIFHAAGQFFSVNFYNIFMICVLHEIIPSVWKRARIQPVPKKGDLTKIQNYRPISLIEVPRKIFEKCLLPFVAKFAEPLSIEQGGFRPERGCFDQVSVFHEWLSQSRVDGRSRKRLKSERYVAFLDIKAAYDSVDRTLLWEICKKKGFPGNLIRLLQKMFDENEAFVAVNGIQSSRFKMKSGVLQGSLLSPLLYSVFIDDLAERLNECDGPKIGNRKFTALMYADDIALMADNAEDLQTLLDVACEHSLASRYRFNVGKCAIFKPDNACDFTIYGENVPVVSAFTYLGFEFKRTGIDWTAHFGRLSSRARKSLYSLRDCGVNGKGFSLYANLNFYRTFIRSIMEYGLALCPLEGQRIVEKIHNEALRTIASVGKSASVSTIGLFNDLESVAMRRESLMFNYFKSVSGKNENFAVYYGKHDYDLTSNRHSIFASWKKNKLIEYWHKCNGIEKYSETPPTFDLKEWREKRMQELTLYRPSSFIFVKERVERKQFQRQISRLPRVDQRNVVLWILNRAGPWITCSKCKESGSKEHFEWCFIKKRKSYGPSYIEEFLLNADVGYNFKKAIACLRRVWIDVRKCFNDGKDVGLIENRRMDGSRSGRIATAVDRLKK